jgi:hypothetical protein
MHGILAEIMEQSTMFKLEQLTAAFGVETVFWAPSEKFIVQMRRNAYAVPALLRRCRLEGM